MPSVNSSASTEKDRARYSAFLKENKASLSSAIITQESALRNEKKASGSVLDMTGNDEDDDEEDCSSPEWHGPNFEQYEELLKELEQRSKLGLLDTLEDTRVAFHTLLGEGNLDGTTDMHIPHSFTIHLAHMFFQRIDPFNVMIKNYEEKQNEMLEKQVERFKKEMDYFPQKLRDNLHEDTKAMVKFMKEDIDAKESELFALKLEHKRLTLQHTVLTSDHELLTNKFSDTSDDAPNSHEQYQRQIDDWHNRCNVKDAETKLLTRQVANLKAVIMEQG